MWLACCTLGAANVDSLLLFFANSEQTEYYFTVFLYVTAHISLAPVTETGVDFINFMDLEMSRGDKAITLLSGDGGGVIKTIASHDEELVERKKNGGYEGGIFRARLPEG